MYISTENVNMQIFLIAVKEFLYQSSLVGGTLLIIKVGYRYR